MSTDKHRLFQDYLTTFDGVTCYFAGLPGYPRNFTRDTITAGLLAADRTLLANQLYMSMVHQGVLYNSLNGEEPGKIHHEYPGVSVTKPYVTTYNACDTTALYLIGLELLLYLDRRAAEKFLHEHERSVEKAADYIERHLKEDIFWEYPPEGAERFSVEVTYWKDSVLPRAGKKGPAYPVTYALAHFQAARGLLAAGKLLEKAELLVQAGAMFEAGIREFMGKGGFVIAKDTEGVIRQASSDELHALAYIPADYASSLSIHAISERAQELVTPAGFAATTSKVDKGLKDHYHGYVVWIYEQALIHYGCQKFGLGALSTIAERCIPYIESGRELISIEPIIHSQGNGRQLWSVAAGIYFSDEASLKRYKWL